MLNPRITTVSLVFALGGALASQAATISTNTIISAKNSFPGETVQIISGLSPPTVIQLVDGGEVEQVVVDADSIFNMHGGAIADAIATRHTSRANILGGSLARLRVQFDSIATLNGGVVTGEVRLFGAQGTPTFNMNGGQIDGDLIFQGRGVANIHGGRVDRVFGDGRNYFVSITSGSFLYLSLSGEGTAHWSGGTMRTFAAAHVHDDSELHVYGRDLALDKDSFLTGELLDGTVIPYNTWIDVTDNGRVFLYNVPEPSSYLLACMAALPITASGLARRRGRR